MLLVPYYISSTVEHSHLQYLHACTISRSQSQSEWLRLYQALEPPLILVNHPLLHDPAMVRQMTMVVSTQRTFLGY